MQGHRTAGDVFAEEDADALVLACGRGHLEHVKRLLSCGDDPNFIAWDGNATPLTAAIFKGNLEVNFLLTSAAQSLPDVERINSL